MRFETPAGRQGQVAVATFTLPWGRRHASRNAYYPLAGRSGTPATINPPNGVPRSASPTSASKL